MVLEVAVLNVKPELISEFEAAFGIAEPIISSTPGHLSHELLRCVETPNRYILLV
ncbi:MAG: antibiotic biosynthesis monooxygenase, partial [candidate division NC10 bacterium]